jgi:hypothetical protein
MNCACQQTYAEQYGRWTVDSNEKIRNGETAPNGFFTPAEPITLPPAFSVTCPLPCEKGKTLSVFHLLLEAQQEGLAFAQFHRTMKPHKHPQNAEEPHQAA